MEMFISIFILVILASFSYVKYQRVVNKAKGGEGKAILTELLAAQTRYLTEFKTYAPPGGGCAPYSSHIMDIDLVGLSYFDEPLVCNNGSGTLLASLKNVQHGYQIEIYEDGTILCYAGGDPTICEEEGFESR